MVTIGISPIKSLLSYHSLGIEGMKWPWLTKDPGIVWTRTHYLFLRSHPSPFYKHVLGNHPSAWFLLEHAVELIKEGTVVSWKTLVLALFEIVGILTSEILLD